MQLTSKVLQSKKPIFFAFVFALFCISVQAQSDTGFGFKAGLNYNANGDYFNSIESNYYNPDRNIGFHFGVFGKIGNRFYLKPELVYTKTKSDYIDSGFNMLKIDAPILVGTKIIGPISFFAGPAFQYILDSEFDNISIDEVENDFSVGFNFGIGLNIDKIGIDLRYERGFNDNEARFIENNITSNLSRLDTRPDQLILSLSLIL